MGNSLRRRPVLSRLVIAMALPSMAIVAGHACAQSQAQPGWTNGPSVSLSIGYDRLSLADGLAPDGQSTGTEVIMTGGAIDVSVLYGMFGLVALVVEASGASVNAPGFSDGSVGHLDASVQVFPFHGDGSVTPYVHAGYGTRALVVRDDAFREDASRKFELTSSGVVFGLGAYNFFRSNLALRIQATRVAGAMSSLRTVIEQPGDDESDTVRVDRKARSTRVNVGLVWYFLR